MHYTLSYPMIITSRLLAGITIGDRAAGSALSISVESAGRESDGKTRVTYVIDVWNPVTCRTDEVYTASDLRLSPMVDYSDVPREAVRTLLSFLSAAAEQYAGSGAMGTRVPDDGWMFSADVDALAYLMSDEIDYAAMQFDGPDDL